MSDLEKNNFVKIWLEFEESNYFRKGMSEEILKILIAHHYNDPSLIHTIDIIKLLP